jgi:hypothetical protein
VIRKMITVVLFAAYVGLGVAQAAILQVSGGKVTGAVGIDIEGALYDVAFREGTCIAVYGGCPEGSDFPWLDFPAAQALIDQVFIDSAIGLFDSVPSLVFGCEDPTQCTAVLPLHLGVQIGFIIGAHNVDESSEDRIRSVGFHLGLDTTDDPALVWAVFTPSRIPEPSALVLLLVGLAGLGFSRRKRIAN